MLLIFGPVGVQQINRNPPHISPPGLERHLVHPNIHLANERLPLFVQHRFDGQVLWVQQCVVFGLPIVSVERSLRIATALWYRFCQPRGDSSWKISCVSWSHVHQRFRASLCSPVVNSVTSALVSGLFVIYSPSTHFHCSVVRAETVVILSKH